MRKLIVCNIMSVDGYFEGPNKNVMVLPMDGAFDAYCAERLRAADTLLLGRTTYDMFRGFWPPVADDPRFTPAEREVSRLDNAIDKVVVSDSLTAEQTDPWRATTRIVGRADADEEIAALKQQTGGDLLVFGSHTLWSGLLDRGLVDELHLLVGNVAVGEGTPLFRGPQAPSLKLIETRTWDGSDNVLIRYDARQTGT